MKVRIETIGPEMAAKLLSNNTRNRSIRRKNVEFFAKEILSGNWKLNAETIKVGRDGTLLDGQHRLYAVVETGMSIQCLLATDLDQDVFDTIDTGARRSAGDTLTVAGEVCGRNLAAALVLCEDILDGNMAFSRNVKVSNGEVIEKLNRHGNIRASLAWAKRLGRMAPASVAAATHYLFSCVDQDSADSFFSKLAEGADLKAKDPVHLLRNRLLENALSTKSKLTKRYTVALFIKAWNSHLAGDKMVSLRFRETGDKPENFPEISGLKATGKFAVYLG